jgi:hypothetical protein
MVNVAPLACCLGSMPATANFIQKRQTDLEYRQKLLARVIRLRKHRPLVLAFFACGGCNARLDFDCSVLGRAAFAHFA